MQLQPLVRFILTGATALLVLFAACKSEPTTGKNQSNSGDPDIDALYGQIAKDPTNDSLYYKRGLLYWKLEAYDEAIADATKAIQLDSTHFPKYYHLLADALLDYGRPNDSRGAIEVLKKACGHFPDDVLTWLKLSEFHLIVRQHNPALVCLDHILQRDPQNPEAYFMSGRVALDMGDTTRAIKALQKSVQIDASNKDAWVMLGRIASNRRSPNAAQYFDNALRLDSTDIEVKEFKAASYKVRGDFNTAFSLYRAIVKDNPSYANAWFDMGTIYLELDSLDQAYKHFDLAIQTDQLFVMAFYYRGVASELKGNKQAAIADYTQAYKMAPKLVEPREALKRLGIGDTTK